MSVESDRSKLVRMMCGGAGRVCRMVSMGILSPDGGNPGQGRDYAFTDDDVRDAEIVSKLSRLITNNTVLKETMDHWRSLGRPVGYVGYVQEMGPHWWRTHNDVMGTLSVHRAVIVTYAGEEATWIGQGTLPYS